METRYLETTIVGHLTGRLLTDPIVASRQQLTRQWWTQCAGQYDLFISQLVIDECGVGAASEELRRRQMDSGRRVVRMPKREPEVPSSNHRVDGIGGDAVNANPESTSSVG